MRTFYCCKLRTLALWVGIVFFLFQTGFLILFLYGMVDIKNHLTHLFDWFIAEAEVMGDEEGKKEFQDLKFNFVRRATDFLAIPITVDIVLMISNSLLIWATASKHKILLWPWLVLHCLEWLTFLAMLIYMLIVMPRPYLKVLLFLVVCPFLVVFAFFWFVIKCFFDYLRDLQVKEDVASIYQNNEQKQMIRQPSTVYSTSNENHWDQPLPIWSNSERQGQNKVLDPALIQRLDPRYAQHPSPSSNTSYYSINHNKRNRKMSQPTRLPDGTLVVPISDETDDLTEIEEEGSTEAGSGSKARSDIVVTKVISAGGARTNNKPPTLSSEDGTASVMSLSDKYRQQDEVEVFEEVFQLPPAPKPILPK